MVKNDKGNTLKNNILNNLHKDIEDMINRKMESSLEKIQSIHNDELKVLRKPKSESIKQHYYQVTRNDTKQSSTT